MAYRIRPLNEAHELEAIENKKLYKVFLAGGISNPWRDEVFESLKDNDTIILLDPRDDRHTTGEKVGQEDLIKWEHNHLKHANSIIFWFTPESLCPISLFELGFWSRSITPIFVGCHPEYEKKHDVEIQLSLFRKELPIFSDLDKLIEGMLNYKAIIDQFNSLSF